MEIYENENQDLDYGQDQEEEYNDHDNKNEYEYQNEDDYENEHKNENEHENENENKNKNENYHEHENEDDHDHDQENIDDEEEDLLDENSNEFPNPQNEYVNLDPEEEYEINNNPNWENNKNKTNDEYEDQMYDEYNLSKPSDEIQIISSQNQIQDTEEYYNQKTKENLHFNEDHDHSNQTNKKIIYFSNKKEENNETVDEKKTNTKKEIIRSVRMNNEQNSNSFNFKMNSPTGLSDNFNMNILERIHNQKYNTKIFDENSYQEFQNILPEDIHNKNFKRSSLRKGKVVNSYTREIVFGDNNERRHSVISFDSCKKENLNQYNYSEKKNIIDKPINLTSNYSVKNNKTHEFIENIKQNQNYQRNTKKNQNYEENEYLLKIKEGKKRDTNERRGGISLFEKLRSQKIKNQKRKNKYEENYLNSIPSNRQSIKSTNKNTLGKKTLSKLLDSISKHAQEIQNSNEIKSNMIIENNKYVEEIKKQSQNKINDQLQNMIRNEYLLNEKNMIQPQFSFNNLPKKMAINKIYKDQSVPSNSIICPTCKCDLSNKTQNASPSPSYTHDLNNKYNETSRYQSNTQRHHEYFNYQDLQYIEKPKQRISSQRNDYIPPRNYYENNPQLNERKQYHSNDIRRSEKYSNYPNIFKDSLSYSQRKSYEENIDRRFERFTENVKKQNRESSDPKINYQNRKNYRRNNYNHTNQSDRDYGSFRSSSQYDRYGGQEEFYYQQRHSNRINSSIGQDQEYQVNNRYNPRTSLYANAMTNRTSFNEYYQPHRNHHNHHQNNNQQSKPENHISDLQAYYKQIYKKNNIPKKQVHLNNNENHHTRNTHNQNSINFSGFNYSEQMKDSYKRDTIGQSYESVIYLNKLDSRNSIMYQPGSFNETKTKKINDCKLKNSHEYNEYDHVEYQNINLVRENKEYVVNKINRNIVNKNQPKKVSLGNLMEIMPKSRKPKKFYRGASPITNYKRKKPNSKNQIILEKKKICIDHKYEKVMKSKFGKNKPL